MQTSFKNRVSKFWKAFAEEESQIREMMDNKVDGETLINYVDSILQIAFNKVYFEMGINNEDKYELILTPEGDRTKLLPLHYWLQYAPKHLWEKWNFYALKPSHGKAGSYIEMYDIKLGEEDIIIYPKIDNERNKINIEIYCPKITVLEKNEQYSILLIYIDQFIGELYTMEYIGYVDFIQTKINDISVTIIELRSFIENIIESNNWPKFENPHEIYNGYRMEPNEGENWKLREDIYSGYTSCTPILNAYYNGESKYFDESKADGITFGFIFFENSNVPHENIVYFRGSIEDKITDKTTPYGIANSLGGATGLHFSYIDFIIYDFEAFMTEIRDVLSNYKFEEVGYSDFITGATPILFDS